MPCRAATKTAVRSITMPGAMPVPAKPTANTCNASMMADSSVGKFAFGIDAGAAHQMKQIRKFARELQES